MSIIDPPRVFSHRSPVLPPSIEQRDKAWQRLVSDIEASPPAIPDGPDLIGLRMVRAAVVDAPAGKFDMETWRNTDEDECGTTACAIGWFCIAHPADHLRFNDRGDPVCCGLRCHGGIAIRFNITEKQSHDLFGARFLESTVTRDQFIARLDAFIAAHETAEPSDPAAIRPGESVDDYIDRRLNADVGTTLSARYLASVERAGPYYTARVNRGTSWWTVGTTYADRGAGWAAAREFIDARCEADIRAEWDARHPVADPLTVDADGVAVTYDFGTSPQPELDAIAARAAEDAAGDAMAGERWE